MWHTEPKNDDWREVHLAHSMHGAVGHAGAASYCVVQFMVLPMATQVVWVGCFITDGV